MSKKRRHPKTKRTIDSKCLPIIEKPAAISQRVEQLLPVAAEIPSTSTPLYIRVIRDIDNALTIVTFALKGFFTLTPYGLAMDRGSSFEHALWFVAFILAGTKFRFNLRLYTNVFYNTVPETRLRRIQVIGLSFSIFLFLIVIRPIFRTLGILSGIDSAFATLATLIGQFLVDAILLLVEMVVSGIIGNFSYELLKKKLGDRWPIKPDTQPSREKEA